MAGASEDVALAIKTLSLKDTCSRCGKKGAAFKRCSVCKQASYCGAECQNVAWKKHKKTCAPPKPLEPVKEVRKRLHAADESDDFAGILKCEGRLEELMDGLPDDCCDAILRTFLKAHNSLGSTSSEMRDHSISSVRLMEMRIDLLGSMERFRDQENPRPSTLNPQP